MAAELVLLNDGRGPEVVIERWVINKPLNRLQGWWRLAVCGLCRLRQTASELSECAVPEKELDIRGSRNATVADFRAVRH